MNFDKLFAPVSISVYCIFTALSAVWISFSFTGVSGFVVTFVSLFVAFCVFVFFRYRIDKDVFKLTRLFFIDVMILNVLTLFSWLFAFLSLYKIEPSIECAIFQGSLPIGVLLCDLITRKASIFSRRTLGISLIAFNLIALVAFRYYWSAGVFNHSRDQLEIGIMLATLGGLSAGIYVFRSSKLYAYGASTLGILCNRFFILLLVVGAISAQDIVKISMLSSFILVKLLLLAFVAVVVPIFALQYSVEKLGASRVSIITPFVPAIALGFEQYLKGWPTFWIPFFILLTCFSIVLANYWMNQEKLQPKEILKKAA